MANEEQVALLRNYVWNWSIWRRENPEMQPDLSEANLSGINLSEIDLSGANLSGANLSRANLRKSILNKADLRSANLDGADLNRAVVGRAVLGNTLFANQDLSSLHYFETIQHRGPSSIDFLTVTLPRMSPKLETFLLGTGQSEYLIGALHGAELPLAPFSVKVFLSFVDTDEELCQDLLHHLNLLERSGSIVLTYQAASSLSDNYPPTRVAFLEADVILLLVSASFLSSQPLWEHIIEPALRRQRQGITQIVPVVLRPVDWQKTSLGTLQPLPVQGKPVTKWTNVDDAFLDIATGLRKVVHEVHGKLLAEAIRKREQDLLFAKLIQTRTELANKQRELTSQDILVQKAEARLNEAQQTFTTHLRAQQELQRAVSEFQEIQTMLRGQIRGLDAVPGREA